MSGRTQRIVSYCLAYTISLGLFLNAAMPSKAANVSVNVDYTSQRQTIEGFGASVTWVANDIDSFSPAKQTQIFDCQEEIRDCEQRLLLRPRFHASFLCHSSNTSCCL